MSDRNCLNGPHEPALHSERRWYTPWKTTFYLACVKCSLPLIPEPSNQVIRMLTKLLITRESKGDGISNYTEYPGKDEYGG